MNNEKLKKLPLTSDIVFKRVFTKEGNEDILKDLLEAILEIPIKEVIVKNPELHRELYDSKAGVLDIKVEIDKNILCDVEMQVSDMKNIDKRSTRYLTVLATDSLKKGEDYILAKNTIVINLLNFEYYKRNSFRSIAHMKFEKTKSSDYIDMGYIKEEEIATEDLAMYFIEIPKFIKGNPKANTRLNQWLWLIAGREEKLEMAKKENDKIKKAIEIIDQMSMDEKEWELYRSRQLAIMNYNSGIYEAKEEGKEEGKLEKQKEIAKAMLYKKMPIELISEITGLTEKEIEKLKNK